MLLGEQQDSSYVGLVVVQRVQLGRGHVERSVLGETVVQSFVQRQQVHVVHRQVVCVVTALLVTHVDQRCSVKSETTGDKPLCKLWLLDSEQSSRGELFGSPANENIHEHIFYQPK